VDAGPLVRIGDYVEKLKSFVEIMEAAHVRAMMAVGPREDFGELLSKARRVAFGPGNSNRSRTTRARSAAA
jgi:hypothetical protein